MLIVAKTNVLAVGVHNRIESLKELPIRLICLSEASQAVRSLKTESIHSVISHWNLKDMPGGTFIKGLKSIRPDMPTIAVIETDNPQQEIQARSLGVAAVVTEDCSEEHFRQIVCGVLGLRDAAVLEDLYAVKEL
jgi:DNA-binding NarL/FixJ family response regulator